MMLISQYIICNLLSRGKQLTQLLNTFEQVTATHVQIAEGNTLFRIHTLNSLHCKLCM